MSRNLLYEKTPLLQILVCLIVTQAVPLGAMTEVAEGENFPT